MRFDYFPSLVALCFAGLVGFAQLAASQESATVRNEAAEAVNRAHALTSPLRAAVRSQIVNELGSRDQSGVLRSEYFETVVGTSLIAAGCLGTQFEVYGFYNPIVDTWLFLEVTASGSIRDIALSAGLLLRNDAREDSFWMADAASGVSVANAIQRAAAAQMDVFGTLFPYDVCPRLSELNSLFRTDEALTLLDDLRNLTTAMTSIPSVEAFRVDLAARARAESARAVPPLVPALVAPDAFGFDVVSIDFASGQRGVYLVGAGTLEPETVVENFAWLPITAASAN